MSPIYPKIAVAILGAGMSTRMRRPKLLLPWKETSVIGHIISQWKAQNISNIAVVCRREDRALHEELQRCGALSSALILNDKPEEGMFSSVLCVANWSGWSPALTHHILALGDQPHLRDETLRSLLEFAAANPEKICQPSWNGRPRHPIVFPRANLLELKSPVESDLKQFLRNRANQVALCAIDDPGLDRDLDTPEDYRALSD